MFFNQLNPVFCIHGNQYAAACPLCLSEEDRIKKEKLVNEEQRKNEQKNSGTLFQTGNNLIENTKSSSTINKEGTNPYQRFG